MLLFTTRGNVCLLLGVLLLLHSGPAFAQAGASFAPTGAAAFAMVVPGGGLGSKAPLELEPEPLFDEYFDDELKQLLVKSYAADNLEGDITALVALIEKFSLAVSAKRRKKAY